VNAHKTQKELGPKMIAYETLKTQNQTADLGCLGVSPHDIVNIQFTSGSTGTPKAAALSHYNIMNCGQYIGQQLTMMDSDRVCLPVPLFHSFGLIIGSFFFVCACYFISNFFTRYMHEHVEGVMPCLSGRSIQRQCHRRMY
jgi:acyl-CoA synthetase (AMP-forming)/AMP-acid ligase II